MPRFVLPLGLGLLLVLAVWLVWFRTEPAPQLELNPSQIEADEQSLDPASAESSHDATEDDSHADGAGEEQLRTSAAVEELPPEPEASQTFETKTVRGQVVIDGLGVAQAEVVMISDPYSRSGVNLREDEILGRTHCDRSGKFEISGPASGFCLIPIAPKMLAKDLMKVSNQAPEVISGEVLELFQAKPLSGEVLNGDLPLAQVSIRVELNNYWERGRNGEVWGVSYEGHFRDKLISDERGAFTCQVPAGLVQLEADKKGYVSKYVSEVNPDDSPHVLQMKVKTEEGFTISGIVLDPDGEPVEGASVKALPTHTTAVTDADGSFQLESVKQAWGHDMFAAAWKKGFAPAYLKIDFDHVSELLIIRLLEGHSIQGKLLNADGSGLAEKMVMLTGKADPSFADNTSNPSTLLQEFPIQGVNHFDNSLLNWVETDANGAFQFSDLPEGWYKLIYSPYISPMNRFETIEAMCMAQTGEKNAILKVGDLGKLEVVFYGQVTDRVTGQPIANTDVGVSQIQLNEGGGWFGSGVGEVKTDESGNYRFSGLQEGTFTMDAKAVGYAPAKLEHQDYMPGEYRNDFTMVEERQAQLSVVDVRGNPVARGSIHAWNESGQSLMISVSPSQSRSPAKLDEEGRLKMFKLPAEKISFTVGGGWGLELHEEEFDLTQPGPHQLQIRLQQAVHAKTQSVSLEFKNAEGEAEYEIGSSETKAMVVRSFDLDGNPVDRKTTWRNNDKWLQRNYRKIREYGSGYMRITVPAAGGRIEIDAPGYMSRSLTVSAAEGERPRQKLSVELEAN